MSDNLEVLDGDQPLVVSPKKAAFLLDCGLDTIYDLMHSGELVSYLEGSKRKIVMASIDALIAKRIAAASGEFQRSSRVPPPPKKKRRAA
jgi:excisionase family DNA binding protein